MQTNRELPYYFISWFFFAILVVLLWGFHRTYTIFFPKFEGFGIVQHFHGAIMLSWVILLVVQPLLIQYRKVRMHKFTGKITYILAPLLALSILMVSQMVYVRTLATESREAALASMANNIPDLIGFIVLYTLAIINRKNIFRHTRYMIGVSFLMIGPGMGRGLAIYLDMPPDQAIAASNYIVMAIGGLLVLHDLTRRIWLSPYLLGILAILFMDISYKNRFSDGWQGFASVIASTFY
jgi:hypothetical protein